MITSPGNEFETVDGGQIEFCRFPKTGEFQLRSEQFFPRPREQVFEFFSDAFQLESLTPPWLHFEVRTPAPIAIAAGTLID